MRGRAARHRDPRGYCRYALSDGAQHDELRFSVVPVPVCDRIEYWFFNGPDSAWRNLTEYHFDAFRAIWDVWREHRALRATSLRVALNHPS